MIRQMEEYRLDLFPAHKISDPVALTSSCLSPMPQVKADSETDTQPSSIQNCTVYKASPHHPLTSLSFPHPTHRLEEIQKSPPGWDLGDVVGKLGCGGLELQTGEAGERVARAFTCSH